MSAPSASPPVTIDRRERCCERSSSWSTASGRETAAACRRRGGGLWPHTRSRLGAFDDGIILGEEGVRIAEAFDHPYSRIVASWGLAYLHRTRGQLDQAARLLEPALALCHDWNLPVLSPISAGFLGSVYALSGRLTEGPLLLEQGQEAFESFQTPIVAQMGEACLLADRFDDAVTFAGRALRLARERGQRGYEAWALHLLGEIAAHPGSLNSGDSEGHYRAALALAGELGMRPLVAHCHLGLGKLYRRMGQREQAHEHLTTATPMYREMDMRYWLEQAEADPDA